MTPGVTSYPNVIDPSLRFGSKSVQLLCSQNRLLRSRFSNLSVALYPLVYMTYRWRPTFSWIQRITSWLMFWNFSHPRNILPYDINTIYESLWSFHVSSCHTDRLKASEGRSPSIELYQSQICSRLGP